MIHRIRKLRALTPPQRRIVLAGAIMLPVYALAIRAIGFRGTLSFLARALPARQASTLSPGDIARAVRVATRHTYMQVQCLPQALYLQRALARHGHASALRIGVRTVGATLEAHAWIEVDGLPLGETPGAVQRFAAFEAEIPVGLA